VRQEAPEVIWWQAMDSGVKFGPLLAGFSYGMLPFATVDKVLRPREGWKVELRHRDPRHRIGAVFASRAKAQQAVERWAFHHWRVIGDSQA